MEKKNCSGPCRWIGLSVLVLGIVCAIVSLHGCAGPSKDQYKKLLHDCRISNRERARVIKEIQEQKEASKNPCKFIKPGVWECAEGQEYVMPEGSLDSLDFGEAGQ